MGKHRNRKQRPYGPALKRAIIEDRGKNCDVCGSDYHLEIHHIKHFASHPELATEHSNIQLLCSRCHDQVHGRKERTFDK